MDKLPLGRLRLFVIALFFLNSISSLASSIDTNLTDSARIKLVQDNLELKAFDSLWSNHCNSLMGFLFDSTSLNTYDYPFDSIPKFDDAILEERLKLLDGNTPFDLTFNNRVSAFINLYAVKRRPLTEKAMGLSSLYFPLFESILDEEGLPLEFKYLAIVESALNPTARSKAGATGLWQFMYATGKMNGLEVTSYQDDRMDPIKATYAACKYFKSLYKIYGDWTLVLAAYNCGPGNVNKAIRRSGYQRDYWKIFPYLPRETRGYVPAFIAVNYIMNYPAEHNLYPLKPMFTFFDFDTLIINKKLKFEQIASALNITMEELRFLNPSYKKDFIPYNGKKHVLRLPKEQVGLFVLNEDLIYEYDQPLAHTDSDGRKYVWEDKEIIHRVSSGQYLGSIASRYGVSTNSLMEWNNLRSTTIHPGKELIIYKSEKVYLPEKPKVETAQAETDSQKNNTTIYYQVQEGDTLWDIAKQKGIDVATLKELNKNLDTQNLKPGEKIVISKAG